MPVAVGNSVGTITGTPIFVFENCVGIQFVGTSLRFRPCLNASNHSFSLHLLVDWLKSFVHRSSWRTVPVRVQSRVGSFHKRRADPQHSPFFQAIATRSPTLSARENRGLLFLISCLRVCQLFPHKQTFTCTLARPISATSERHSNSTNSLRPDAMAPHTHHSFVKIRHDAARGRRKQGRQKSMDEACQRGAEQQ
jgi:hypothetical protein